MPHNQQAAIWWSRPSGVVRLVHLADPARNHARSCRMNARYFNLELLQLLTHNKIVMVDQPSAVQEKAGPGPKNLGKVVRLTLMVLHDGKSASCAA
jgi:hypothetical protein